MIVGSPISSSLSSNSRSKLRGSASPSEFLGKDSISSPFNDENEDDDDDNELKSDDSEIERKRKKSKKSKRKKSKKKRKKKRNKSISSIENISDSDLVLDDEVNNLTPPLRTASPTHWDKRGYTPSRVDSLSKSPMTPPLRPNSNMSIYSDTSRRTPPITQKYIVSSPHTPPIVPRKSTSAAYHSSPIDIDVNSSHSHSHFHHSSHHGYHHQRSPNVLGSKDSAPSRRSKSPREYAQPLCKIHSITRKSRPVRE